MKDLINGTKKFIKDDQVRHMYVPQYETLTVKEISGYIELYPEVRRYLPIQKELKTLPKQFLVNVIYTIVKGPFNEWVKGRISERNTKIMAKRDLLIDMDPDVAAAFENSNAISGK